MTQRSYCLVLKDYVTGLAKAYRFATVDEALDYYRASPRNVDSLGVFVLEDVS